MSFLGFDKKFYRSLFYLTFPVALQFFLFHVIALSDNWMVASLGSVPLAGVAMSNKVTLIVEILIFGISNGVAVFTAQAFSVKDFKSVHQAYSWLLIRTFLTAFIIFIPAFLLGGKLLSFVKADQEVLDVVSAYLPIVAIAYIPMSFSNAISWIMRSFKQASFPLYSTALALVVNIGLNYIFLFVLGMGVTAVAVGTIIARLVELSFLVYASQRKELYDLMGFRHLINGFKSITKEFKNNLFKLVLPVAFNELLWALSITTLEFIYVGISRSEYSSYVIANGVSEFSYFIFHALAISCGILLGNHAKDGKEVLKKMGYNLVRLGFIFALFNVVFVYSLSYVLPPFFPHLEDPTLIETFLKTIAIFTFFNLLTIMMNISILRAGGDTLFALVIDMGIQWLVSIPLVFYLSSYYPVSVKDLYIVVASIEFCKFVIYYFRVRSGRWVKNLTHLQEKEPLGF